MMATTLASPAAAPRKNNNAAINALIERIHSGVPADRKGVAHVFDPEADTIREEISAAANDYSNAADEEHKAKSDAEAAAYKVDTTGKETAALESKQKRAKARYNDCSDRKPIIPGWVHAFAVSFWIVVDFFIFSGRLSDMGMNANYATLLAGAFVVIGGFSATLAGHLLAHIVAAKSKPDRQDTVRFWLLVGVIVVAFIVLIVMTTPPAETVGGKTAQIGAVVKTVSLYGMLIAFAGVLSQLGTDTSQERRNASEQHNNAARTLNKAIATHNANVKAADTANDHLKKCEEKVMAARNALRRTVSDGRMYEERTGANLGLDLSNINLEEL